MKKEDAVNAVDSAGHTIHDVYGKLWSTALSPGESGWGPTLLSIGCIPVANIAVLGHFVAKVLVEETPDKVFEVVPDFGKKK